ncbi:MAG: phytanoyl-CoA dioxygenase family protein [Acidimicrobiia bacterium]
MIRRLVQNLGVYDGDAPPESLQLEREGWAIIRGALTSAEAGALAEEIDAIFEVTEPERGRTDEYRYEMSNRSAACQRLVAHPRILAVIEPLLGDDCHVIADKAWRNVPEFEGGPWHCDAGPHVPRPEGVPWDDRIPYPVFAIGAHILLHDLDLADGPTVVIPGSHRSGRLPPFDRMTDPDLTYNGRPPVPLVGSVGDVSLFVSDVWHRGLPADGGRGRYFLQVHYGRRDIAQRIRPTARSHQLSPEAVERATTERERSIVGLHDPYFYDA